MIIRVVLQKLELILNVLEPAAVLTKSFFEKKKLLKSNKPV
jgi:hypothetical protein